MFAKLLIACLFSSCIQFIIATSVPFITKCKIDDAKCMRSSSQAAIPHFAAGLPELGIETLDPFHLKNLDVSSPSLKLILSDVTGIGLSKCTAKKIEAHSIKLPNLQITANFECDVTLDGQYEIGGNIAVIPIEGKGPIHIVLRKVIINVEAAVVRKEGKDGLPHWSIKSYEHSYELKDKATLQLENLFNGNEELGRAAKELFKNNPNEVVTEVGPPIVKAIVKIIVDNVAKFFRKIPLTELLIE